MNSKRNSSKIPARVTATPDTSLFDASLKDRLASEIQAAGGEMPADPELAGSIGTTMFDASGSQDNTVTVVLSQQNAQWALLAIARTDQEPLRRRWPELSGNRDRRPICGAR